MEIVSAVLGVQKARIRVWGGVSPEYCSVQFWAGYRPRCRLVAVLTSARKNVGTPSRYYAQRLALGSAPPPFVMSFLRSLLRSLYRPVSLQLNFSYLESETIFFAVPRSVTSLGRISKVRGVTICPAVLDS